MFASVVWPKGRPPSDKPECGFNNELCEWLINGINYVFLFPVIKYDFTHTDFLDNHLHRVDTDITLLTLLVALPVMGVMAVLCIGVLVLQKLRLQTKLDESSWWLISYSDITIIRESLVQMFKCVVPLTTERAGFHSVFVRPPGSSAFISHHDREQEWKQQLSVQFLQHQLWTER